MKYRIEINELPKSPNVLYGKHWRVRHQHMLRWLRLMEQALIEQERAAIGRNLETAVLTLTRYSEREMDADNLAGSFKHVLDSLVKLKVIKDDKPSVIGSPTFLWVKAARKEGKITIEIREFE